MGLLDNLVFKIADQPWEFEAIHALNYKTFVEEIPQHTANHDKALVDKYHEENTYVICVDTETHELAGMVAVRDTRPFSLDHKLENLQSHLPPHKSLCEVRLLAIEKKFRSTRILIGLVTTVVRHGIDCDYDLAIISGTTTQKRLYAHIGFVPFGPLVGAEDAQFQPMYLTVQTFNRLQTHPRQAAASNGTESRDDSLHNFLPGPVDFFQQVHDVYNDVPCSHRGRAFMADFQKVRDLLCRQVNAGQVEILMGSGTLANDAVAGQISLLNQPGLILVSGEFGRRLVKSAKGARIPFETLDIPEGQEFQREDITKVLAKNPDLAWIWGTHCETSTGVLNDLAMYRDICRERGLKLCLDCISSVGTVPVDLSDTYLASATSGKGLASFAGLAMVFHNHDLVPAPDCLPCAIDLGIYQEKEGIPFTIQSNLVYALLASLTTFDWEKRYRDVRLWSESVRRELEGIGASILAPALSAMPSVVTIPLPQTMSSQAVGDLLKKRGILISYGSSYLVERNWIQVCMMGAENRPAEKFIRLLREQFDHQDGGRLQAQEASGAQ